MAELTQVSDGALGERSHPPRSPARAPSYRSATLHFSPASGFHSNCRSGPNHRSIGRIRWQRLARHQAS